MLSPDPGCGLRTSCRRAGPGLMMILSLLGGSACRPARPPGEPADAVQRFYAAVSGRDCATALSTLGSRIRGRFEQAGCEQIYRQIEEHPLERVISTQVDGRDREAQLVRARLRGRTTDVVIRVQAEDGQWKISSM
jgi:hypothetical protein